MHFRNLGKTGLSVSEIGLGSNRLGQTTESETNWDSLTRRALDLGVNIFDTAERYANGKSEEVLGRVVGERPGVVIASTRCARKSIDSRRLPKGLPDAHGLGHSIPPHGIG